MTLTRLLPLWVLLAVLAAGGDLMKTAAADPLPPIPAAAVAVADLRSPAELLAALERLTGRFPGLARADDRLRQASGVDVSGLWALFGLKRVVLAYGETGGTPWLAAYWQTDGLMAPELAAGWIARRFFPVVRKISLPDGSVVPVLKISGKSIEVVPTDSRPGFVLKTPDGSLPVISRGDWNLLVTDPTIFKQPVASDLTETLENPGFRTFRPAKGPVCALTSLWLYQLAGILPVIPYGAAVELDDSSFSFGNHVPSFLCHR